MVVLSLSLALYLSLWFHSFPYLFKLTLLVKAYFPNHYSFSVYIAAFAYSIFELIFPPSVHIFHASIFTPSCFCLLFLAYLTPALHYHFLHFAFLPAMLRLGFQLFASFNSVMLHVLAFRRPVFLHPFFLCEAEAHVSVPFRLHRVTASAPENRENFTNFLNWNNRSRACSAPSTSPTASFLCRSYVSFALFQISVSHLSFLVESDAFSIQLVFSCPLVLQSTSCSCLRYRLSVVSHLLPFPFWYITKPLLSFPILLLITHFKTACAGWARSIKFFICWSSKFAGVSWSDSPDWQSQLMCYNSTSCENRCIFTIIKFSLF